MDFLAKKEDSPAKKRALRDLRRERCERRWRKVLQAAEEDRHVSHKYLADLIRAGAVPDFARCYVADRISRMIAPPGRPALPPLDPGDLDTLWHHFDGADIPRPGLVARNGVTSLFPPQFMAVVAVRRRHARYKAFKTAQEPRGKNKPRLRYIESRRVWRVKDPKGEALSHVARRLGVTPARLSDWERQFRAWESQVRIFRARSRLGALLLGLLRIRKKARA